MRTACAAALVAATIAVVSAWGQLTERPLTRALIHPAIEYASRPTHDAVADLIHRLDEGSARLTFEEGPGYLRSALDALHVPVSSQMLVVSKGGVQGLHTEPSNPRAIYFNDSVTIGYIRGAPLLEFAVQDPEQGVVFYTIDQKAQARPAFDRSSSCLRCHVAYNTLHVPGMLARSAFVTDEGLTLGQYGGYDADDRTPFDRRWGGWYVTGTHGTMRHMGNAIVKTGEKAAAAISDPTLNRTSLEGLFDPRGYPSALSDIAALMVFQHQVHMMNLITRVGWEARMGSATLDAAIEEFVDYALFVDEVPLTSAIKGTSGFAEWFAAQGPRDQQGRSLRQLDLERRLLRYPCSYMVYSPAFSALPAAARQAIYRRMDVVLTARRSAADRNDVTEILRDTLPDFPR